MKIVRRTFYVALVALLFYICAAFVSPLISFDVTQTEWTNVWVYVIWALGPFALILMVLGWVFLTVVLLLIVMGVLGTTPKIKN